MLNNDSTAGAGRGFNGPGEDYDLVWMKPPAIGNGLSGRAHLARIVALAVLSLGASTIVIAAMRAGVEGIHVSYPAPVYLLAVLVVGMVDGAVPAVATSVAAFLLYDFLFVQPLYTFTINSPDEWLTLLLLLAVSVVIGRLAALLAERANEAANRAREAEALHTITGILASTTTVAAAGPAIATSLESLTAMDRVWVMLGRDSEEERPLAGTAQAALIPSAGWQIVLQRNPDGGMRWVRAHVPTGRARGASRATLHRVRIEAAGEVVGSLWAIRRPGRGEPDRAETRILSAAADQLGLAIVRDRLSAEATTAEIARQSEAVKTALLDSVSHDLRTPLATIRATAGSMLDPAVHWTADEEREAFESIDSEAERMGRLVRNLLDLSRIEGGALKPELETYDLAEFIRGIVARAHLAGKTVSIAPDAGLPAVYVDEIFLGQVIANLLENAIRYGGASIEIHARAAADRQNVELRVEDDGEGVPGSSLARLFDKFYQVPRAAGSARRGMGIGLTVVAGMVAAMGGTVRAERSELGGLAVAVTLPALDVPVEADMEAGPADASQSHVTPNADVAASGLP